MAKIVEWESNKEYDKKLSKIEHYRQKHHPEMMPFIGSHYKEAGILLIGESHYCSKYITEEDKSYLIKDWYNLPTPENFTDKEYFNTRYVLHNFLSLKRSKAHSMFRNPANSIINALELKNVSDSEAFNACAFMNYFQRPELETGGSINNNEKDNEVSYNVFIEVCNILQPKLVLFLSKDAFEEYKKQAEKHGYVDNSVVESFSHPTCSHWYGDNGRTKFESIIRKYVEFNSFYSYNTYTAEFIKDKKPNSFKYIEKGQNRFCNNTKTLRTYGSDESVTEIVVHTKAEGRQTGVGYVIHHNFIWIWDYDKKEYIDTNDVDNYPGLKEMYTEFIGFIKEL